MSFVASVVGSISVPQALAIARQEELGWVLADQEKETDNLARRRPVQMRNALGDLATIHVEGFMRPVRNEGSLLSITDCNRWTGRIHPAVDGYIKAYTQHILSMCLAGRSRWHHQNSR